MSLFRKIFTLGQLVARGDGHEIFKKWRQFRNNQRVKKHSGKAFAFGDFGFPAVCHPDWIDSLYEFLDLRCDQLELGVLAGWLAPGDAVMDIGTNLGVYSFCFCQKVGPSGEVISVDADNFIIQKLVEAKRILSADQLQAVWGAVTEREGTVEFFIKPDQSATSDQSLIPPKEIAQYLTPVAVPAFTVQSLLGRLQRKESLSLVKMDIEGAEASALKGVPVELMNEEGPLWQIEINGQALERFGNSPQEVVQHFSIERYDRWLIPKEPHKKIKEESRPRRLTEAETFQDAAYYNLICVPLGSKWKARRSAFLRNLGSLV